MRRLSTVLLGTAAAIAIPFTVSATAGAAPLPETVAASGVNLKVSGDFPCPGIKVGIKIRISGGGCGC